MVESYNYKDLFETVINEIKSKIKDLSEEVNDLDEKYGDLRFYSSKDGRLDAYQRMCEYALKAKAEMGVE